MSKEDKSKTGFKLCACGCREKVSGKTYWKYGKKHYSMYISGHNQRGKHGGRWNECHGRTKKNEYWYVLKREHHFADRGGYVLEHRLIYEEYYRCILLPWADVHHIDGNPENNDILNLYACMHGEHTKLENKEGIRKLIFSKGHIPWNKGMKVGYTWNKGIPCSEETKRKISESQRGRTAWNKGLRKQAL